MNLTIDGAEPRFCVARLGKNGPIIANSQIDGFQLFGANQTDLEVIQTYPDGSQMVEMTVVESPLLSAVTVEVSIIVGGVVFDDGTLIKQFKATDFNPLGEATVRFVRPADAYTSVCHKLKAFQDQVSLGVAR